MVEQSTRVTDEIQDLAAANEEQVAMVTEVESAVMRLAGDRAETDGGATDRGRFTDDEPSDNVSIPDDLPDGMPAFVIERLSDDELHALAAGDVDPADLMD